MPRGSASPRGCLEADFTALVLVLVIDFCALALALSQDRDQGTDPKALTSKARRNTVRTR